MIIDNNLLDNLTDQAKVSPRLRILGIARTMNLNVCSTHLSLEQLFPFIGIQ